MAPSPPPERAASSPPAPAAKPALWKLLARLIVSVGVLAILVVKTPDLGGVVPRRNHLHSAILLAAALLLTLAGIVLSAWRWQRVLRAFDRHVGLGVLTAYTLAGQFVGKCCPRRLAATCCA